MVNLPAKTESKGDDMGAKDLRGVAALAQSSVARRSFLVSLATTFAGAVISTSPVYAAVQGLRERRIVLNRSAFGEKFSGVYWEDGQYIPEALEQISHLFREPKNGKAMAIDPALVDGLVALQKRLDTDQSFDVVSGFRLPDKSENGGRVVRTSYHFKGMAADIRLPGRDANRIFSAARELNIGGVGRYAGQSFVHMDTGEVRTWAWGFGSNSAKPAAPAAGKAPAAKPVAAAAPPAKAPPAPLARPR